jgi:Kef-type K+ transport system membrane component KefB
MLSVNIFFIVSYILAIVSLSHLLFNYYQDINLKMKPTNKLYLKVLLAVMVSATITTVFVVSTILLIKGI